MTAEWIIYQGALAIKNGKKLLIPSANCIYAAEFKKVFEIDSGILNGPPSETINISLSRFPAELVAVIENGGNGDICFHVDVKYNAEVIGRSFDIKGPDHLLSGKSWYPVSPESIDSFKKLYAKLRIKPNVGLKIKEYLRVVSYCQENEIPLENNFNTEPLSRVDALGYTADVPGLNATLYEYQKDGCKWLKMMAKEGIGCVLADEMGLGKTLQAIGLIVDEKNAGNGPALVVAPATILENWRRELSKFAPHLVSFIHQGATRPGIPDHFVGADVVISSYETVRQDIFILNKIKWNLVVLDEAQAIRNPDAKRTEAVKQLSRRIGVAISGTPLQNRLLDVWSITDFAIPGILGTSDKFRGQYGDDEGNAGAVEKIISPILLRRKVKDVAGDLPEKIEVDQPLLMTPEMAEMYEAIRSGTLSEKKEAATLADLTKLRMFCVHPGLSDTPMSLNCSPKYERLLEVLEEIFMSGAKALVFVEYNVMRALMQEDLPARFNGIFVDYISGEVEIKSRQPVVDRFNAFSGPGVLILNPNAAGVGLNITGANHVVHYHPMWNPAVMDQATARAYRRGQKLPVTVHMFYYANSMEQVMLDVLSRKRKIAESAVVGTDRIDKIDIVKALNISPALTKGRQTA